MRPRSLAPGPWSSIPPATEPWLLILRDSQVVRLVRTAVANNRDLRIAAARVQEYRALRGVARGDLFPQISANGVASREPERLRQRAGSELQRGAGDGAIWPGSWISGAGSGGRPRRRSLDFQGREEDERAAVVSLVSDVVTGYLQLRELDQAAGHLGADAGIPPGHAGAGAATIYRRPDLRARCAAVRSGCRGSGGPGRGLRPAALRDRNTGWPALGTAARPDRAGCAAGAAVQAVEVPDSIPESSCSGGRTCVAPSATSRPPPRGSGLPSETDCPR